MRKSASTPFGQSVWLSIFDWYQSSSQFASTSAVVFGLTPLSVAPDTRCGLKD
jgi:hypothetical protein